MKRVYHIYYSIVALILLAGVFQTIFIGSSQVTYGSDVQALEAEKAELTVEHRSISNQIAETVSLAAISSQAQAAGYATIDQPVAVIFESSTVASR